MKDEFYIDTLHGFRAKCRSRKMAWALIRNKCHKLNLEVPTLNKIVEEHELDCPFEFTSRCTMDRCDCKPKADDIHNVVGQSEQFNCFLEDSEQGERCESRCNDCKEYKGTSN